MADVKINVQVITAAAQAAVKNLNTLIGVTTKGFSNVTKGVENLSKAIVNVSKAGAQITNSLSKIAKNTSNLFGKFVAADLASAALRRLGSAAVDLVKDSLQVAVSLEKASARFQVFTGSVSEANKFVKELAELEDQTPFEFEQIANAAQKLLSFGRSTEQTKADLQSLADVATASGASIEEVATIFGKAASAGVISGRELNGLQANSIPIIAELSKQLGVTGTAVKKLANEGKIDFATFEEAFKSLSKEGGFAFGATQKQAETLGGKIKTLGDSFEQLQITIGQRLGPAFKAIISTVTTFVSGINGYVSSVDGANKTSNVLITSLNLIAQTALIVVNAFNGLNFIANTFLGILTIFPGYVLKFVTAPLQLIVDAFVGVTDAIGLPNEALKKLQTNFQSIRDFLPGLGKEFFSTADDIGTSMAANKEAVDSFGRTLEANYNKEVQLSNDATKNAAADAKKRRDLDLAREEEARLNREKAAQEAIDSKRLEEQKKADEEEKKRVEKLTKIQAQNEAELALQLAKEEASYEQALLADGLFDEQDQKSLDAFKFYEEQKLLELQIGNAKRLGEKSKAADLEAKLIKSKSAFEIKTAKDVAAEEDRLNKLKVAAVEGTFNELSSLTQSKNKQLFQIGKAAAVASSLINTYQAVTRTMAETPYPFNIPLAIAQGVAGLVQVNNIKAQSPSFEDGGIVPGNSFNGDNVTANVNSGEMILNRQQQAQLFQQANGQSGGGQMTQINTTVMLDSEVVARAVSKHVADGFKLGEVF